VFRGPGTCVSAEFYLFRGPGANGTNSRVGNNILVRFGLYFNHWVFLLKE